MNILIVDDSPDTRLLFQTELGKHGYAYRMASNGNEALEVLAGEPVDLALVDIMMPGMTGLSLFQHIKERHPDVAVVFITAVDDLNIAVARLKDGAYDYVVKPVARKRLRQVVEEALDRRKAILGENQHRKLLAERTAHQAKELEARSREVVSLNRMFQADLTEKLTRSEAEYLKVQTSREKQLQWRVISLQESARKSISEYLQSHVLSKLLALEGRLEEYQELVSSNPEKASTLLGEIKAGLHMLQEHDIGRAARELYPSIVEVGLVPALKSIQGRFHESLLVELDISAEVEGRERHDMRLFPEEFKMGVYRIVEEALENVVKHARVETARVALYNQGDGYISLDITDEGRGFEAGKVASVSGLLSMKEYAGALGGSCQIASAPGRGTRVHVTLPAPGNTEAYRTPGLEDGLRA